MLRPTRKILGQEIRIKPHKKAKLMARKLYTTWTLQDERLEILNGSPEEVCPGDSILYVIIPYFLDEIRMLVCLFYCLKFVT